jgi:outer membrane protein TolC
VITLPGLSLNLRNDKNMKLRLLSLIRLRPVFLVCLLAAWLVFCAVHRCGAGELPKASFGTPRAVLMASVPTSNADDVPKDRIAPSSFAEVATGEKLQENPLPSAMAGTALFAADEQLVDFFSALQLAEAQNPNIGLSRQAIQEALAQQLQARSMMLPSVRAGANYRNHQGVLQTSSGKMIDVNSSSLYLGNGALTEAAGTTVIPGVQVFAHLGDGIFEPLAARQLVASRNFQAQATSNQILLEVAGRFLDLVRAEAELQALRQTEKDMDQAVQITRAFAKAKQGREADAMRAQTTALLLHSQAVHAEENLLTAAAELARALSLDPAVRLRAPSQSAALLELVDARQDLEALLSLAQAARPELAALSAEIARKQIQVRQERIRPFLPTISLGFSAGSFGGGPSPAFGKFNNRTDVDLIAYWTLQNMGMGNRALQKERLSEQDQMTLERERMLNVIGREVADAQALVLSRWENLDIARSRLVIAERAFQEDLKRIRGNVGLPIELLNSLNRLASARVDVVRVVQEYNLAQMQLFVALGQTPLAASAKAQK